MRLSFLRLSARLPVLVLSLLSVNSFAQPSTKTAEVLSPEVMVEKFSALHQNLMPKVAVADIFYGCNLDNKPHFSFSTLINKMDKNELGVKLMNCLGEDNIASDRALNFGIKACFIDEMEGIEADIREEKLKQVDTLLQNLPKDERQRTFTQCVNNQTLKYLTK